MMTRSRCISVLVSWGLLAGVLLGCWLVSPAAEAARVRVPTRSDTSATTHPDQKPNDVPEIVDRGAATPAALLESMAMLLDQKAPTQAWLGLQPPAMLPLARMQLELASQLGAKTKSVAELVQAKIGRMEAGMVGSTQSGVRAGWELELHSQMAQIARNGKVDWAKVKITERGDKAEAVIVSTGSSILLAKAGGKWYLGEGEGHDTLAKDINGNKEMTSASLKMLEQVEQKVKSGQMTKANFIQEYTKLVNQNMGLGRK